jgi:hypothetical protein
VQRSLVSRTALELSAGAAATVSQPDRRERRLAAIRSVPRASPGARDQLFLPVIATNAVGMLATLSLPHFGHGGLAVPCSDMVSTCSKLSPHCSQRYAYVGIAVASHPQIETNHRDMVHARYGESCRRAWGAFVNSRSIGGVLGRRSAAQRTFNRCARANRQ